MNEVMAKDLQKLFIDRGYNPVIGTIYQQQQIWLSWYRGNVDGFHEIQKKNLEGTSIAVHKPTLQMAKKVSEDLTSLLFNEKVQLVVNNDEAQSVLNNVLDNNNYHDEMVNFIELTCVYGTGLTVEYKSNNETKLNFMHGDRVIIIDYENTTPTAVAVIQEFQRDKKRYHHIMYHTFIDGKYKIQHEMYSSSLGARGLGSEDSLGVLFTEQELNKMRHIRVEENTEIVEYYVEYETDTPHFQVFKLGISNNYDVRSPLGISLYANSIGTLENIDEKYYSSRMDSINSRKRIFVDDEASKIQKYVDGNGNITYRKYFDQDETQYQVLKGMQRETETPVVAFTPTYNSTPHDEAIQMELNYLASKCMLGSNYYSFKDGAVGYLNEMNVIASNSDTFRNRQKNINKLKKVIIDMMKSIMYLEKDSGNFKGDITTLEYDVQFDDDIITDDATIIERLRKDSIDGIIPQYKYVMKAYGVGEDEAKAMIEEGRIDMTERNKSYLDQYEDDEE